MINLTLPIDEKEIRKLKIGDNVLINGTIITGRDQAHKFLVEDKPPDYKKLLNGYFLYHCGPVVKKSGNNWEIVAAGPTTSIREEPYQATVIKEFGVRGVIGKGGMGNKTLKALSDYGCVYLHAIGGLASVLAKSITKVKDVYKLDEFGSPEAFWILEVKDFPAVVTMDSHGKSLHNDILEISKKNAEKILSRI